MLKFPALTGITLKLSSVSKFWQGKSNSLSLKTLQTKFQLPLFKMRGNIHTFLVTSRSVEKQLSLVPNMFITLTATANKH